MSITTFHFETQKIHILADFSFQDPLNVEAAKFKSIVVCGKVKIICVDDKGYTYCKTLPREDHLNSKKVTSWRCRKRTTKENCKASIGTLKNEIVKRRCDHNHPPS